jgi:helix-turn-helix protein
VSSRTERGVYPCAANAAERMAAGTSGSCRTSTGLLPHHESPTASCRGTCRRNVRMTAERMAGLRALAEALPPETPVPVPAGMLLELLGNGVERPSSAGSPADATVADLATRFGRSPSTVRGWLDRGLIPGAYRFQRREWRVPAAALAAFEAAQRPGQGGSRIGAPSAPRGAQVDLGAWRNAS